jgi:IS5 family transposase
VLLKYPSAAERRARNHGTYPTPRVATRTDRSRDYKTNQTPRRRMNHRTREDIEFVLLLVLLIVVLGVAACYFGPWLLGIGAS